MSESEHSNLIFCRRVTFVPGGEKQTEQVHLPSRYRPLLLMSVSCRMELRRKRGRLWCKSLNCCKNTGPLNAPASALLFHEALQEPLPTARWPRGARSPCSFFLFFGERERRGRGEELRSATFSGWQVPAGVNP